MGAMIVPAWILEKYPNLFPTEILWSLRIPGGALLAGAVVCWRSVQRGRPERFFYSLAVTIGLASTLFAFTMEVVNRQYSTKELAHCLKDKISAGEEIYVYDHPGPFYDFAFYLNRDVKLVGLEGELEFSRKDSKAGEVSVTREAFVEMIRGGRHLYCLIRRSDFKNLEERLGLQLKVLKEDPRKILFYTGGSAKDPA
jgi:hypothetical protein